MRGAGMVLGMEGGIACIEKPGKGLCALATIV